MQRMAVCSGSTFQSCTLNVLLQQRPSRESRVHWQSFKEPKRSRAAPLTWHMEQGLRVLKHPKHHSTNYKQKSQCCEKTYLPGVYGVLFRPPSDEPSALYIKHCKSVMNEVKSRTSERQSWVVARTISLPQPVNTRPDSCYSCVVKQNPRL